MTKHTVRKILIVLLLAAAAAAAAAPLQLPRARAQSWMAALEDSRSIGTLSIPGTHDSGALYSFADLFGKCQTLSVSRQLQIGVRFLDVRLRLVEDELLVYHNFVEQKTSAEDLMEDMTAFLQENPSEFLIVSFKEEASPVRSGISFAAALEQLLARYPRHISTAGLPASVGEARGKIHILARYENNSLGVPCSLGWQNNSSFELGELYIQDHYKLHSAGEKLPDITAALEAAASGNYALVLNFTSCYLAEGFPPSYAGVTAGKLNPLLPQLLADSRGPAGVLVCDFMTSGLAEQIIGRNFT